jgi:hypothetical protein
MKKDIRKLTMAFLFVFPVFMNAQQMQPLTHDDIVLLASSGNVSEETLIGTIRSRKVSYTPDRTQLRQLIGLNVSGAVLDAIDANPAVSVRIESPENNSEVAPGIIVTGTVTGTQNDLWVLVFPELAFGKCWPQSEDPMHGQPASVVNNKFSTQCYLGGPNQRYDIVVYSTNATASAFFSDLMIRWSRDNNYPGIHISEIPAGAREEYRVTVTKR